MKTYLTLYVPQLDILKTISKEIISIDTSKYYHDCGEDYYTVEPYIYTSNGSLTWLISKTQLNNLKNNLQQYESQIIAFEDDYEEHYKDLLECTFDIKNPIFNNIAIVVSYIGDCKEYIGEKIAIERMKEYAENLKILCLNKLNNI